MDTCPAVVETGVPRAVSRLTRQEGNLGRMGEMRAALLAALSAALFAGCFGRVAANEAARVAARQHGCPRDRVSVESDGGNWTYWLRVCGRRRLYSTRGGEYRDITDSVGGGAPASSTFDTGSSVMSDGWSDADVERLRRATEPDVRACFPGRREAVVVRITITTRGHISVAAVASEATTAERSCVSETFSGARLTGTTRRPRMTELAFDFAPDDGVALSHTIPPEVEAAARAAVTAHAPAIVACLGGAAALDVSIATDGTLAIAARGALAGSAEEACARAALGAVTVSPAPSAPETILHAVAP